MIRRIAILGFLQETNAFAPVTTQRDYQNRCLIAGEEILEQLARPNPPLPVEVDGFCQQMERLLPDAWMPVPILVADAEPGGPVEQSFFEATLNSICSRLKAAGDVDGVYVVSHGAMRAERNADPEGALYTRVREIVGPDTPMIATLDLHANVSEAMAEQADVLIAYRTNPHVDQRERAAEAARAMQEMFEGMRPKAAFIKVPIAAPSVTLLTAEGPYADLINYGQDVLKAAGGGILNVSVVAGFIYSDSAKCGMSIIVTARSDMAAAKRLAADIAARAWDDHRRYQKQLTPVANAVREAVANGQDSARPSQILADVADNPGGGGTGATTTLLAALHQAGAEGVVIGMMIDPGVAKAAHRAGKGNIFTAEFNAHPATEFDAPFVAEAEVLKLSDGGFVGRRGILKGRALSLGPTALIGINGIRVAVASNRKQCSDPAMLEMLGVDLAQVRTLVLKSRGHFRAGFDEFFSPDRILEVDCPGLTSPNFENFKWTSLRRPVFPLDPETTWQAPPLSGDW